MSVTSARLLAVAAIVGAAFPLAVRSGDALTGAAEAGALLFAAMGLNLAVGFAGQPSLGQGGFVAVGAFGTAILVTREGFDPVSASLLAVAFAIGAGAVVARGVSRLRPAFVALATWLFSWGCSFALVAFPRFTGGARGASIGRARFHLRALGLAWTPGPVAYYEFALVCVVVAAILGATTLRRCGPAFAAVRSDPSAARAAGVPVERLRAGALITSAGVGGMAGALLALNAGVADPTSYGPVLSVKLFIVVLLGGAARQLGPAAGLVALLAISRLARAYASAIGGSAFVVEPLAAAAVLGAVLLFGTEGIVPIVQRLFRTNGKSPSEPAPATIAHAPGTAIGTEGVRVSFGGIVALDDLTIEVDRGTVHAIVGPNGSGKTTLLRVLGGALRPDAGEVIFAGTPLERADPIDRARRGVARTLQRAVVAPGVTAAEFVLAGLEQVRRAGPVAAAFRTRAARREERDCAGRAGAALAISGLERRARAPVETLSGAELRMLQVARAIASGPRVVLLDEPSSGLDAETERRLAAMIRSLRDGGQTVAIVEHNLRLVRAVADRVTVLDAGRVIAAGTVEDVVANPAVRAAYLGPAAIA